MGREILGAGGVPLEPWQIIPFEEGTDASAAPTDITTDFSGDSGQAGGVGSGSLVVPLEEDGVVQVDGESPQTIYVGLAAWAGGTVWWNGYGAGNRFASAACPANDDLTFQIPIAYVQVDNVLAIRIAADATYAYGDASVYGGYGGTAGRYLDYGSGGWAWTLVATGAEPGFYDPAYDDSGWNWEGVAPFGTMNGTCDLQDTVQTLVVAGMDLLLRRHVILPSGVFPSEVEQDLTVVEGEVAVGRDVDGPALPTNIQLSSDNNALPDGTSVVRLIVQLTQPLDTDLLGSYVEITRDNDKDDANPQPVWTKPDRKLCGVESSATIFEGVAANARYWVRATGIDIHGNRSGNPAATIYTTPQSIVTALDTVAPPIPEGVLAVGGYRGVAVSWNVASTYDIAQYQVSYGTDGATYPWILVASGSTVFVTGLDPSDEVTYYFRVQAIDTSSNQSGWSDPVSAKAYLINANSSDIAAGTILAEHIATSGLKADQILSGQLTLSPETFDGVDVLIVKDATDAIIGTWSAASMDENSPYGKVDRGITLFGADASDYAIFDAGTLSFYLKGVLTAQISPEGVLADSLTLGTLQGGHNVIANSSFELAAFVTAPQSFVFTDTNTWKAGTTTVGRHSAVDNITEGTALSSTLSY